MKPTRRTTVPVTVAAAAAATVLAWGLEQVGVSMPTLIQGAVATVIVGVVGLLHKP